MYLNLLKDLNIKVYLYKRYVDDQNSGMKALKPGIRYVDKKLVVVEEEVENDKSIPADQRTAAVCREIANTIAPMIQLEEDVPSGHPNGKLPILDLEVWVENGVLTHTFYKKPMASRKVIFARSAGAVSEKRSILVQEGMRRLHNCDPQQPWETKAKYISQLMVDMKRSGHRDKFRNTVAQKVVGRYRGQLKNHLDGTAQMYRSKEERQIQMENSGGKKRKDNWFRDGGYTSTIRMPPTPGSSLATEMRNVVESSMSPKGTKPKVTEIGGRTIWSQLGSNHFQLENCGRGQCGLCAASEGGSRGKCWRQNVGYTYICNRCENPDVFVYIGETSRSCFTRHKQHLAKYKQKAGGISRVETEESEESATFMWDHTRDYHGGVIGPNLGESDYTMFVDQTFRDTLTRQVDEDVRMRVGLNKMVRKRWPGGSEQLDLNIQLMNGHGNYFRPKSVRTFFNQW